jgi:small-conductance mechanosensitive channel/CRP-like cAMP-binding protein
MRLLNLFDHFIENFIWLAAATVLLLVFWLFAKRTALLKQISENHPVKSAMIDLIAAPLMILLIGNFAQNLFAVYSVTDTSDRIFDLVLLALLLSTAWCLARLFELFFVATRGTEGTPYLPGLQRGLLFTGALFVGVALFIYLQGYSITGLYISTGAVAALLAFAMQQTLGDLFSGIALSIEHPFKLGERIRLADGSEGKVVDINWRATRLLAWDNSTLVVPNSELAKQGFTNLHGSDHLYAPWYEVKIPADVDPRLARALLLEAALRCEKVLKDPLPLVRLIDASTIPYTYMIWVHFSNYPSMFAGREQLFQEIHYALKDVGAQVSPSINELHTKRADTMSVEPPTTMLALKMLDITKSLSDEELEQVANMSRRETFEAGAILISEGEIAQSIDVIIHGVVETSVMNEAGEPTVVGQLRSGQYFGLTSMLMETTSFQQFSAKTNVTVIRIDIECMRHVLVDRTDLHDEFAVIMKQRMDTAQDARLASAQTDKHFTIRDFLRRMEQWTR